MANSIASEPDALAIMDARTAASQPSGWPSTPTAIRANGEGRDSLPTETAEPGVVGMGGASPVEPDELRMAHAIAELSRRRVLAPVTVPSTTHEEPCGRGQGGEVRLAMGRIAGPS